MESNDSPEIPDRGETSDIPGLPSGVNMRRLNLYYVLWYATNLSFSENRYELPPGNNQHEANEGS